MKAFAAAVLGLSIISCAPPYVVELDRAAGLVNQMTLVGTAGPIDVGGDVTGVTFLPTRPTDATFGALKVSSGFVIIYNPSQESVAFLSGSTKAGPQSMPTMGNQYLVIAAQPGQAGLLVANVVSNAYQYFTASPGAGSLSGPTTGAPAAVALSEQPGTTTVPDSIAVLETTLQEGVAPFDGGSPPASLLPPSTTAAPVVTPPQPAYYYTDGTTSFLSSYGGGPWVCQEWAVGAPSATTLAGVTHRIDALLSTGELLSTEGGTLRLYDQSGSQEMSLDLKGLQFCYEAKIGTTDTTFFALPISVKSGQYAFNIYAIPSFILRDIKG